MSKTIKIMLAIVGVIVLALFLIVHFAVPGERDPEPKVWGKGRNPFKPGDPRYANFEKTKRKREDAIKKEIDEILNEENHGEEDKIPKDKAREE